MKDLKKESERIKANMDEYWFRYTPVQEMDISKMSGRQMAEEIRMWRRANLFDDGKEIGAILYLLNNFHKRSER
jgi:hypothetical protein